MNGPLIVSDTSPLNYLVHIGADDILPKLVSVVLIPPAVAAELADTRKPHLFSTFVQVLLHSHRVQWILEVRHHLRRVARIFHPILDFQ